MRPSTHTQKLTSTPNPEKKILSLHLKKIGNHYGKKIQYFGYLRPKETLYGGYNSQDEGI